MMKLPRTLRFKNAAVMLCIIVVVALMAPAAAFASEQGKPSVLAGTILLSTPSTNPGGVLVTPMNTR